MEEVPEAKEQVPEVSYVERIIGLPFGEGHMEYTFLRSYKDYVARHVLIRDPQL